MDTKFKSTITQAFNLVEKETNPSDCMHALKFAGLVNLEQLLRAPLITSVASSIGLFASIPESELSAGDAPAAKL